MSVHYLIGRDLDGDGKYEFIQDINNMILTENANKAIQFTKTQINQIDMAYLNAAGFYAIEADRFQVSLLESLMFAAPLMMGFRPRVAPPPRRRRMPPPPPPRPPRRRAPTLGEALVGAIVGASAPKPPRPAPKPRPLSAVRASAPRVYGPMAGGGTGSRSMGPGGRGPGPR